MILGAPALPGKMAAGQTIIHWNTTNFQGMTFGFESAKFSVNENE
jgi:hypothetical protein